jgi:hypothetical protein
MGFTLFCRHDGRGATGGSIWIVGSYRRYFVSCCGWSCGVDNLQEGHDWLWSTARAGPGGLFGATEGVSFLTLLAGSFGAWQSGSGPRMCAKCQTTLGLFGLDYSAYLPVCNPEQMPGLFGGSGICMRYKILFYRIVPNAGSWCSRVKYFGCGRKQVSTPISLKRRQRSYRHAAAMLAKWIALMSII